MAYFIFTVIENFMIVPEVILYNLIKSFMNVTQLDYNTYNNTEPDCTLLSNIFKQDDNSNIIKLDKYNFLNQAKSMLLRDNTSSRKLQHYIGYNLERVSVPTIHILLPSDNKGRFDSIGKDETSPYIESSCIQEGDEETTPPLFQSKKISSSSSFHLMLTSDNSHEVLIMYYWLKAMFTIFHETPELLGLRNLVFSGQDITLQENLAPPNIFHRNLTLTFDYENIYKFRSMYSQVNAMNFLVCTDLHSKLNEYYNQ